MGESSWVESLLINEGLTSLNASQTCECVSVWKQKRAEKEDPLKVGGDLDLVVRSGKLDLQYGDQRARAELGGRWQRIHTPTARTRFQKRNNPSL